MEKKIAEVQQAMAETTRLTAMYLPMNPDAFKQALQTRRVDFEHDGTRGSALVINDYAKPGDQLILTLDMATMRIRQIAVNTYFASSKEMMTATVQFTVLEDGTTYPSRTAIEAPSKHLSITTESSNFTRPLQ
jgi:hypothetical protein